MVLVHYVSASPAVGYNFPAGSTEMVSNRWRAISKIAFYGATAPADIEIEIFFGNKKVGNLLNTDTGDVFTPALMFPFGTDVRLPPKTPAIINLKTTPGSVQLTVSVDWVEY